MLQFHFLSLEAQFVFGTHCKAVGLICKYSVHRGSDGLVLYSTDPYCIKKKVKRLRFPFTGLVWPRGWVEV